MITETNLILFLFLCVIMVAAENCEPHQSVSLKPYVGTEITFPENFPSNTGYSANLSCAWKITANKGYEIVVFPVSWSCSNSTILNLSTSTEIDSCVGCPAVRKICLALVQTRSSAAALDLFAPTRDFNGGFNFRFTAVNSSMKDEVCKPTMLMRATRTPNYIISPNFPDSYPSNLNCSWRIEPDLDNNTKMVFQFLSENLERGGINSCNDYVDIEGLGVFCETSSDSILKPSSKMPKNSSVTTIRFVSDFGKEGSGFVLSFYLEDFVEPCLCRNGGSCMNSTCICAKGYKSEYCEKASIEILSLNVTDRIVREENSVAFTAEIFDTYNYTVQWFRNEILVTSASTRYKLRSSTTANGSTIHTLNITRIYTRDEGTWKVLASNGVTSTSRQVNVTVLPRLRLEMSPQYDFSIQSGKDVRLECNVSNPMALKNLTQGHLVLTKNRNNLTDTFNNTETSIHVTLKNVSTGDSGLYSCFYSTYPDPVQVSIQLNVIKTAQKVCIEEKINDITWNETIASTTRKQSCPNDQLGTATRICDYNGNWKTPNLVNCTDKAFVSTSQELSNLIEDGINTTKKVEETVNNTLQVMKNLTSSNKELSAGDLKSSVDIIEQIVNVTAYSGAKINETDFFNVVDNVLSKNNSQSWTAVTTQTSKDATSILKNMDKLSEEIMKGNSSNISFSGDNFDLSINQVNVVKQSILFPSKNINDFSSDIDEHETFLELPKQNNNKAQAKYVAVIYKTISDILSTDADSTGTKSTSKRESETRREFVNSDILSLSIHGFNRTLDPPLNLTFKHKNYSTELYAVCVSWDFNTNKWSEEGCQKFSSAQNKTVCLCNHLTNFAILMRPYVSENEDSSSLKTLSLVGVICSIVFIVLTIAVYILSWKHIKNDQNIMLLNLCGSLILSYIVFVSAVEKTDAEILCTAVTVIIHYLFLVTFFNMLGMGVYYFMSITVTYYAMYVANNFKSKSRIHWFLIGVWGIPLVISTSTMGGFWNRGYHLNKYCWLSMESGSLYMFIVPVCCIVVMNIAIIVSLIRVLCASSVMIKSTLQKKAASGLRSLGTLLPVLGVTWLFGILAINENAEFFQYLFIVANSLQGLFIFVSHVLLNKKLMQALRTQYPSLTILTSFTESGKKEASASGSQTFTSDDLMGKSKKRSFYYFCCNCLSKREGNAKKVTTSESLLTEKTTSLGPFDEKPSQSATEL